MYIKGTKDKQSMILYIDCSSKRCYLINQYYLTSYAFYCNQQHIIQV